MALDLVAQRRHSRTQLLLVECAVAIVVPLAEEVDQPHRVLQHGLAQLFLDALAYVQGLALGSGLGLGSRYC